MKYIYCKNLSKSISFIIFLIFSSFSKVDLLNAEYYSEELDIETTTKTDENNSVIPTNPFEMVEMIRRQNILNDSTKPSDAIDDALKSFESLEEK